MVRATAVFVGSMLGAGIFGLPYAFAQAGWGIGALYLVGVGFVLLLLQLLIAEVTIQTPGERRLSSLAGLYLGRWAKVVTTILIFGSVWGAVLAYIILGGGFLYTLFGGWLGGDPIWYAGVFVAFEALLISFPLRKAAGMEVLIGGVLLCLFVVLILAGLPEIHIVNITSTNATHWFVPYGVVLFALSGLGVSPEMHNIFGERSEHHMPRAILVGFSLVFALYAAFTFVVVGVSGDGVTQNALLGYTMALDPLMQVVGSLVGLLTISSILFMMGEQLKDTMIADYEVPPGVAEAVTLGVPFLFFLLGLRDLVSVIGFVGAVFSALTAVMFIFVYERLRKNVCRHVKCFTVPRALTMFIGLVFVAGAIVQIVQDLL